MRSTGEMGELECSSVSKGSRQKGLWVSTHIWPLYNPPQIEITHRGTRKHNVTVGLRLFPSLCVCVSASANDAKLGRHDSVTAFHAYTQSLHTQQSVHPDPESEFSWGHTQRSLLYTLRPSPSPTCNFATTPPQPRTTLPKITLQ